MVWKAKLKTGERYTTRIRKCIYGHFRYNLTNKRRKYNKISWLYLNVVTGKKTPASVEQFIAEIKKGQNIEAKTIVWTM